MKLNTHQLNKQLQTTLSPIYVVSGDEMLLCIEAQDAILTASKQAGYNERQSFNVDTQFDWNLLYQQTATLSLFSEKRVLELHLKSTSLSDKGAAILDYLKRPAVDTILLIMAPKLDTKLKWVKALLDSDQCQFIQIWPIETHQLPQWIQKRLANLGLSISTEALELFTLRVEGNLLAAAQEIEKLKLLMIDSTHVDLKHIQSMVVDSARFDIFGFVDTLLDGDATHSLRMLQGLQSEGVAETLLMWAITKELRTLATLSHLISQGLPIEKAFSQIKPPIWNTRQGRYQKAVLRLPSTQWQTLLVKAQQIDAQIKGQLDGDPWQSITTLSLHMTGTLPP